MGETVRNRGRFRKEQAEGMVTGVSEEVKKQVIEMSVGIVFHNLVLFFISIIWFRRMPVFLGILAGMTAAVLLLISMARSTELCVEAADEDYARRKMMLHAVLRNLAVFIALAVLWKFAGVDLFALILGILGLKTGAYLYPSVHRFLDRKKR